MSHGNQWTKRQLKLLCTYVLKVTSFTWLRCIAVPKIRLTFAHWKSKFSRKLCRKDADAPVICWPGVKYVYLAQSTKHRNRYVSCFNTVFNKWRHEHLTCRTQQPPVHETSFFPTTDSATSFFCCCCFLSCAFVTSCYHPIDILFSRSLDQASTSTAGPEPRRQEISIYMIGVCKDGPKPNVKTTDVDFTIIGLRHSYAQ